MEWIETLNQILDFQVVEIGSSAITAKHILLFTVALLITATPPGPLVVFSMSTF